jgi:hypothetical protein
MPCDSFRPISGSVSQGPVHSTGTGTLAVGHSLQTKPNQTKHVWLSLHWTQVERKSIGGLKSRVWGAALVSVTPRLCLSQGAYRYCADRPLLVVGKMVVVFKVKYGEMYKFDCGVNVSFLVPCSRPKSGLRSYTKHTGIVKHIVKLFLARARSGNGGKIQGPGKCFRCCTHRMRDR